MMKTTIQFVCPNCGNTKLSKIIKMLQDVENIEHSEFSSMRFYPEPYFHKFDGYQCSKCELLLKDKDGEVIENV